jgi:hypothetical protein
VTRTVRHDPCPATGDLTDAGGGGTARLCAVTKHLRRKLALVAGLIAVATPVLSACGSNAATDRYNVLANAGYDLGNGMRVAGARIVASADGQGVFVATITLNPSVGAATTTQKFADDNAFTSLAAAGTATSTTGSIDPVSGFSKTVDTQGIANLNDGSVGGVPVTGDFKAGDIVPLVMTFADGSQSAVIQTPVVTDCFVYSGAGTDSYAIPSADPSPSQVASPGAYDCAYPSLPPVGK